MSLTLTCLTCGQGNRFPEERLGAGPKCGTCGALLLPGAPAEISLDMLKKAEKTDSLPLVVDFWASWCGPCRAMAPEFTKASQMLKGRARFVKLDTEAFPDAGARYQVRGIPLLVAFQNGREIGRQTGVRPAQEIADWALSNAKPHRGTIST